MTISRPDVKGRVSILEVHVKDRKLAADVNLMDIAKLSPGLVGADLANIVNEAAIMAVRGGHDVITVLDFQEAVEKSLLVASSKRAVSSAKANGARSLIMKRGTRL